jgi:predicted O-methyltransferase YrrM
MIDPFSLKSQSRAHPGRVAFTLYARAREAWARRTYERHRLPDRRPTLCGPLPAFDEHDTAVSRPQMHALLSALQELDVPDDRVVVEVGAYRGVTTRTLASHTARRVVAVDPFAGYGGSDEDFARFQSRTRGLDNVEHIRATSGAAARSWSHGPVGLVFIDAVHDYVNAAFDANVWGERLSPGGFLAMHDVDTRAFAGARAAAFRAARRAEVWAHVDNLAILRKPAR